MFLTSTSLTVKTLETPSKHLSTWSAPGFFLDFMSSVHGKVWIILNDSNTVPIPDLRSFLMVLPIIAQYTCIQHMSMHICVVPMPIKICGIHISYTHPVMHASIYSYIVYVLRRYIYVRMYVICTYVRVYACTQIDVSTQYANWRMYANWRIYSIHVYAFIYALRA